METILETGTQLALTSAQRDATRRALEQYRDRLSERLRAIAWKAHQNWPSNAGRDEIRAERDLIEAVLSAL